MENLLLGLVFLRQPRRHLLDGFPCHCVAPFVYFSFMA
jgi:hypothetical protein